MNECFLSLIIGGECFERNVFYKGEDGNGLG